MVYEQINENTDTIRRVGLGVRPISNKLWVRDQDRLLLPGMDPCITLV